MSAQAAGLCNLTASKLLEMRYDKINCQTQMDVIGVSNVRSNIARTNSGVGLFIHKDGGCVGKEFPCRPSLIWAFETGGEGIPSIYGTVEGRT